MFSAKNCLNLPFFGGFCRFSGFHRVERLLLLPTLLRWYLPLLYIGVKHGFNLRLQARRVACLAESLSLYFAVVLTIRGLAQILFPNCIQSGVVMSAKVTKRLPLFFRKFIAAVVFW